jgi:hypothetical protein
MKRVLKSTGQKFIIFNPNWNRKIRFLFDAGRTNKSTNQHGRLFVYLKPTEKFMRGLNPHSFNTNNPMRGRSKQGGQRVGAGVGF